MNRRDPAGSAGQSDSLSCPHPFDLIEGERISLRGAPHRLWPKGGELWVPKRGTNSPLEGVLSRLTHKIHESRPDLKDNHPQKRRADFINGTNP
jgi:hypothetical protein